MFVLEEESERRENVSTINSRLFHLLASNMSIKLIINKDRVAGEGTEERRDREQSERADANLQRQ